MNLVFTTLSKVKAAWEDATVNEFNFANPCPGQPFLFCFSEITVLDENSAYGTMAFVFEAREGGDITEKTGNLLLKEGDKAGELTVWDAYPSIDAAYKVRQFKLQSSARFIYVKITVDEARDGGVFGMSQIACFLVTEPGKIN